MFEAQKITPTAEQKAIQTSDAQAILVHANAGAAKTTSLALRIAEGLSRGITPSSILALTYTEPACDALRTALLHIGVAPDVVKKVWISSFERFAAYCLKSKEGAIPKLLSTPEALQAPVWAALEELRESFSEERLAELVLPVSKESAGNGEFVERFLRASLRIKGTLVREKAFWEGEHLTLDLADALGQDFSLWTLLGVSENLRCPRGADVPAYRALYDATYDLARFIANPDELEWWTELPDWPRQVAALMVDEMHDVNHAMFAIIRALLGSNPQCYFCGVGDVDQVIHASAGADRCYLQPALFEQETARPVKVLPLTASYRFSTALAQHAGHFAKKAYAAKAKHSTTVTQLSYTDDADCVQQVLDTAEAWRKAKGKMSQFVVLLRHPHQSVLLENALVKAQQPYDTRGFDTYLHRPEVLLVRSLLAIATRRFESIQSPDTRRRMVEQLVSFCGVELTFKDHDLESPEERLQDAIKVMVRDPSLLTGFFDHQILPHAQANNPRIAERLLAARAIAENDREPQAFSRMLDALDMPTWANTHWVEEQRRADALAHFEGLKTAATSFGSAAAFFDHLNNVETTFEERYKSSKKKADASALWLADIPSVKGLEFEHVVVPFLAKGKFPSAQRESMDDERNLFYVAMTRAKSALTLLGSAAAPSGFLGEL